jgi:hypothetical protein
VFLAVKSLSSEDRAPTLVIVVNFWVTEVISRPLRYFIPKKQNEFKKTVAFPVRNCAAEAALALKSTGTGLVTENATATIYHPVILTNIKVPVDN